MASFTSKVVSKRNPSKILHRITSYGKSIKQAMSCNRRAVGDFAKKRNIAMGFWDGGVFHPIRASKDYSASRAGEGRSKRAQKVRAKQLHKRTTRRARKARRSAIS
jgi:hypothetical protein